MNEAHLVLESHDGRLASVTMEELQKVLTKSLPFKRLLYRVENNGQFALLEAGTFKVEFTATKSPPPLPEGSEAQLPELPDFLARHVKDNSNVNNGKER